MDITPYIDRLQQDFLAAAALGDERTKEIAGSLGATLQPSVRLALMQALSDFAAQVTAALDGPTVDLRLDGRDVQVVVTPAVVEPPEAAEHDLRRIVQEAGGDLSRTTVRLFNELKAQAEQVAADQGLSLNTFISRAVSQSVRGFPGPQRPAERN